MSVLRLSIAVALCVAIAAGARAAQFTLDARRDGEAVELVAVAELRSDAAGAWAVLSAYERYADFIPDISASRVVARDGDTVLLDLAGAVRFLWWRVPLAVRLAIVETPKRRVQATLVSGDVHEMQGEYEVVSRGSGVKLRYHGRIVPDPGHRSLFDLIVIRINVARQFRALLAEIERSDAREARPAGARTGAGADSGGGRGEEGSAAGR